MFLVHLMGVPVRPAALSSRECLVVRTSAGKVRGTVLQYNIKGTQYSTVAFYGIPFAEPPIGRNRFMEPKCVKPWNGTFSATSKRPPCKQLDTHFPKNYTIDASNTTEDCLHINVWVPGPCANPEKPHAVVFWVYGGAFSSGGNSYAFYDARFVSGLGNLVVAAPNYRLSLFGFLNSGTRRGVRGNMGLHDLVLALRWVRDNIGHFGGDTNNILVAGGSSGAISLSLLMDSPLGSLSSFRRAYLMSGTPNTPLVRNTGSKAQATFQAIAAAALCSSKNTTSVLRCLQERDASALLEVSKDFSIQLLPSPEAPLLPPGVVKVGKRDTSHLEVILGTTFNEGMLFFQNVFPQFQGTKQTDPKETMKVALREFHGNVSDSVLDIIITFLRVSYDIDDPDYKGWIDLISDVLFRCPTKSFAIELAQSGATAYYQVYVPKPSFTVFDGDSATHGEDVLALFGTATFLYPHLATNEERETTLRMIRTLADFATNGSMPTLVDGTSWPVIHNGSYDETVLLTHAGYNHSSAGRDCLVADSIIEFIREWPTSVSKRAVAAFIDRR
ncbi:acetylcholinesterase-like [Rhipicephalus microplus]|uniref:acetylcholinesterase-like n=1 Tax=Rhipicephalus microplus TaxID=6941 RepID=UPI003F6AB38D